MIRRMGRIVSGEDTRITSSAGTLFAPSAFAAAYQLATPHSPAQRIPPATRTTIIAFATSGRGRRRSSAFAPVQGKRSFCRILARPGGILDSLRMRGGADANAAWVDGRLRPPLLRMSADARR